MNTKKQIISIETMKTIKNDGITKQMSELI